MSFELRQIRRALDLLLFRTDLLLERTKAMSVELDQLEAQVHATRDAEDAAVLLIQGLADQIKAAGNDPAKLNALQADLKASADRLAAAVMANTPAGGGGTQPGGGQTVAPKKP